MPPRRPRPPGRTVLREAPTVLGNLIHQDDMPAPIARRNRSFACATLSDRYDHFRIDELLAGVEGEHGVTSSSFRF